MHRFRPCNCTAFLFVVTLVVAALLLIGCTKRVALAAENDGDTHDLFLPIIQGGSSQTPAPPPTGAIALFADTEWRTSSASIATDAAGGLHLAHTYYHGLAEGVPTYGVYLYCPRNCGDSAQWEGVGLGELVNEIQVALTPQGKPRLLYRSPGANNGWNYSYAACDNNCTDPAQWLTAHVASNTGMAPLELSDDERPQRYFALDNWGRPRFVYGDRTPGHLGTFYAFCDDGCTDPNNWGEARINKDNGGVGPYRDEDFYYPALTFSTSGQPRVVADGVSMEDEFLLFYVACDQNCDRADAWRSVPLFARGGGFEVSYDVEINAQGQPRIAFFEGAQLGGGGNLLWYAWCNSDCTEQTNWQRSELGLARSEGQEPDLELDRAGRPHIAYALYGDGGLGYSVCASGCEGSGAKWQHRVAENRHDLLTAWPVAHPSHCSGGLWDGLTPSLVLDGSGAPTIAYDVTYYARCHYVGENRWEPWNEMNLVWRAVRLYIAGSTDRPTPAPGTPLTPQPVTPTATTVPTATPVPTEPSPARMGVGLFPESMWRTGSSDIAVDDKGGLHLAYVYIEPNTGPDPDGNSNPTSAVYSTCQRGCDRPQNWHTVTLGEAVSEVQIDLTLAGLPRLLLLERAGNHVSRADRYVYAKCDSECTARDGWSLGTVITVPNDLSWRWADDPNSFEDEPREYQTRRYFRLDPKGQPRFVYYHYNADRDPQGVGAYYAACDNGCTASDSWTHMRITKVTDWSGALEWEILEEPALAFTTDGQPRLLAALLPLGPLRFPALHYIGCDVACEEASNWRAVQVGESGDVNGTWDLVADELGSVHMVLANWTKEGIRYGWCNVNCLDFGSWQYTQLPGQPVSWPLDIELNAQGQLGIAFTAREYDESGNNPFDSLTYLWCNSDCQSADGWQRTRVETNHHLLTEWLASYPAACAPAAENKWSMVVPALAIAPTGLPYVASDVVYTASCTYDAETQSWQPGGDSTVWRAVHIALFSPTFF